MTNFFDTWLLKIVAGIIGVAVIALVVVVVGQNGTPTTQDNLGEPPPDSIRARMVGKTVSEKANIKAQGIVDANPSGMYVDTQYGLRIEIQSVKTIDKGVEIFARAWKNNIPIGFGVDGDVEVERFLFYNPPILVHDSAGPITREVVDPIDNSVSSYNLREDPSLAIREDLAHTIFVSGTENGPVIPGKRGNTSSTFHPVAGANAPVDGWAGRDLSPGSGVIWGTLRAGAGNLSNETTTGYAGMVFQADSGTDEWIFLARGHFTFDTSAISPDTVDSAVISFYGIQVADPTSNTPSLGVYESTLAATNDVANADYQQFLTTAFGTAFAYPLSTSAYNDMTLNASGLANIATGGTSKFVTLNPEYDVADTAPTWGSNAISRQQVFHADETGTSKDPKLVVQHSAGAADDTSIIIISSNISI